MPASDFLDSLFNRAISENASDIHLELDNHSLSVRYRKAGQFINLASAPPHLARNVISQIKANSGLNIADSHSPQDGMLQHNSTAFRVAVSPSKSGETLVLRLLGSNSQLSQSLDSLGFTDDTPQKLRAAIQAPNGLILTTGSTGSGKTTTLYACLNELIDESKKIITVEDPVEYPIPQITQIQVDPTSGLSFENTLRSVLRQDPDIILIGEIRDPLTAQIAFQAALTGHLVLSTLHTSSTQQAIPRLLDLGIKNHQIQHALRAILNQKLITENNYTLPVGKLQTLPT